MSVGTRLRLLSTSVGTMNKKTKRELREDIEAIKKQTDAKPATAFETEDGQYYDKHGNRITDFSEVIVIVPPAVWTQWQTPDMDMRPPIHDTEH